MLLISAKPSAPVPSILNANALMPTQDTRFVLTTSFRFTGFGLRLEETTPFAKSVDGRTPQIVFRHTVRF